jgi:Na+/proline symporter
MARQMLAVIDFAALDWFWVAVFIVVMFMCGLIFYRLAKRSESEFFLAGRGLPWWLPATSIYATHTATDTPVWITGVIYKYGMRGVWIPFFCAWCAVSAFVSTRIFRRSLAMSQAEWQNLRYSGLGSELLRGWLAGWQTFMNMFVLAWVSAAMGKVGTYLFGWPHWMGLTMFTALCAIYVLSAGYWGVIMSDFQQGVIAFIVINLVCCWGIYEAGGPAVIVDKLQALGEGWRLNPFHFDKDFPLAWFLTLFVMATFGGIGMGNFIDWYPEAQRIQSARTLRDASYSIYAGSYLTLIRNGFWVAAILAFYVMYPGIADAKDYEMGWYRLGFEYLPMGMIGVFFAGILAIHLSTISGHLNLGAMYATRDLYHHYINPQASQQQLVRAGRINTFLLLVGCFVLGLGMRRITDWLIFALWLQAAGIWLPSILQVVWWRFNSWAYLSAWIANLVMSWLVVWVLPAVGVLPKLQEYQQFWLLAVLVAVVYVPVMFLTRPDDMEHLIRYYVMARPLGWWGPVRREAIRRGLMIAGQTTKQGAANGLISKTLEPGTGR